MIMSDASISQGATIQLAQNTCKYHEEIQSPALPLVPGGHIAVITKGHLPSGVCKEWVWVPRHTYSCQKSDSL